MPNKLNIKNLTPVPCTPFCISVRCTSSNRYVLAAPAQDIIFKRSDAKNISALVVNINLPIYLGCTTFTSSMLQEITGSVELKVQDILSDGTAGIEQVSTFNVSTVVRPYNLQVLMENTSGLDMSLFEGCRIRISLSDAMVLSNEFALCNPPTKFCNRSCGRIQVCTNVASILLSKRIISQTGIVAGDTIVYGFTVTNNGPFTLENIIVTDPLGPVTGGPLATLAAGASDSSTFTLTYIITPADETAGEIKNQATVAADPVGSTSTIETDSNEVIIVCGCDTITNGFIGALTESDNNFSPWLSDSRLVNWNTSVNTNGDIYTYNVIDETFTLINQAPFVSATIERNYPLDDTRIVWEGSMDVPGARELYTQLIDGTGPIVKLNSPSAATNANDVSGVRFSPDKKWVTYYYDAVVNGIWDVFTARTDGSGPIVQHFNNSVSHLPRIDITNTYVAFDAEPSGFRNLFISQVGIPGSTQLTNYTSTNIGIFDIKISPDESLVLYIADADLDNSRELYAVATDGLSPPYKLNTPHTSVNRWVRRGLSFSQDGTRVIYRASSDIDTSIELYSVPILGGPVTKLNIPHINNSQDVLADIQLYNDYVIYRDDLTTDSDFELYSNTVTGGSNVQLAPESNLFTVSDGFVYSWDATSDSIIKVAVDGSSSVTLFSGLTNPQFDIGIIVSSDNKYIYVNDSILGIIRLSTDGPNSQAFRLCTYQKGADAWLSPDDQLLAVYKFPDIFVIPTNA